MSELVSIIVPVYKVEKYLSLCVSSILSQSYRNIEVILIDDGSPDNSGAMCDQFGLLDNRVKVVHKLNGGLSSARNEGLDIADGKYVVFVDSDDWVHTDYISTLYNLLISEEADISVCNFIKTSDEKVSLNQRNVNVHLLSNLEAVEKLCGELYEQLVVAWGKMFKLTLFNGIRYPIGKVHEDEYTTYKLLYKAKKVVVTNQVLIFYRQRPDSIMGSGFNLKNRLHAIEAYEERADFFENEGVYKLRNKTLRALFNWYRSVLDKKESTLEEFDWDDFNLKFKTFIIRLRLTEQSIIFKIFYEMYLKMPRLAALLYKQVRKQ